MSKIVQVVNAMISHPYFIRTVQNREDKEIFFTYKQKYKWSILHSSNGEYLLWFYPGTESIETLSSYDGPEWEVVSMVSYRDAEIGTKEAKASFAELYNVLTESIFGMDKIFNDILSDTATS